MARSYSDKVFRQYGPYTMTWKHDNLTYTAGVNCFEFLLHGVVSGYRHPVDRLPMWRHDAVGGLVFMTIGSLTVLFEDPYWIRPFLLRFLST